MRSPPVLAILLALLAAPGSTRAGLYYSGEQIADLPSQWRGFLLDQRMLRNVALKPSGQNSASTLRRRYEEEAAKLETLRYQRKLTADELADLGALWIRVGETAKAVELLRAAQRAHPHQFRIVANLGTAWQLQGDLDQAAQCLQEAVQLAPGKWQEAERYHLQLVRLRQRQPRATQALDDLFGIRYQGDQGSYEPGTLAAQEREKLPSTAMAITQQLALWLPADGRLLWQLAELANALGDVRTAAAIMDGCVTEFGLHAPELRQHRQILRAAADELARSGAESTQAAHERHAAILKPRSKRPLSSSLLAEALPPISATGINALPWSVLADTTLDRKFKPTFPKYLEDLDRKQVFLAGFIQPLGEDRDLNTFMLIEYPVGCWYCEMPEMTGIVLVEMAGDQAAPLTRGLLKITGKLTLNATDPENFLYTLTNARATEAD